MTSIYIIGRSARRKRIKGFFTYTPAFDKENSNKTSHTSSLNRIHNPAKSRGDAPVGSVVVQDGSIIAEGIEGGKTKKVYHLSCRKEPYAWPILLTA